MTIDFTVEGNSVRLERDQFSGRAVIVTDEGKVTLDSVLNPFTHFSIKLVKTSKCIVYGSEVIVEKMRPLFFAAFRPSKYRIFVNGEVVAEQIG